MKKIGIIITDPEDWTARALSDAAKAKGFYPVCIDLKAAEVSLANQGQLQPDITFTAGNTRLSDLEAVLVRDVGAGTLEGVSFRFDILRQLEATGIPVVNSSLAIQNAANKYHTSYLLARAGLPVPETAVVQSVEAARQAISKFGDSVIKPVFGYKGKDILRIKDGVVRFSDKKAPAGSPEEILEELLRTRGMLYIQRFIQNPGRDIRAFVVGGSVVGAIYRKAPEGSWINNLSQGGKADRCILTGEQKAMAEKAAEAVGAVFAGVDIIEETEGTEVSPMVLEVNGTPSGKGIFEAWGINPAEYIMEYIQTL